MFENFNDSALIDKWQQIKNIPFSKFGIRLDKGKHPVKRKDDDVHKLFTFLKLIPTSRQSFEKAAKSLLVYSEVNFNMALTKVSNEVA